MSDVVISVDSVSIIPERVKEFGIAVIPEPIIIDGRTCLDTEVDMDELYARLDDKQNLPHTSAINVDEYLQHFIKLAKKAEAILHLCMSSAYSPQYTHALQAKELAEAKIPEVEIEVIDSLSVGAGVLLPAIEASRVASRDINLDEVSKYVTSILPLVTEFTAQDTLFYVDKGGRAHEARPWVEAEVASSFKSIIESDASTGGRVKPVARAKTMTQILERFAETTKERAAGKKLNGVIAHARSPERAERLKEMLLSELTFGWLHIAEVPAAPAIHRGRGFIDLAFCEARD
ncbi:MAG: DegV family EDD domain-containing protein [Dehalococcoidales bacterium]|nr:DegV family EDD domain-containing protein [Dehalococcoidales bacterium]